MKLIPASIYCILFLLFISFTKLHAQDADRQKPMHPNSVMFYIGILEANINYERNVGSRLNSYSKVRLGYGYGEFLTAGEGRYINTSYVYLAGSRGSHLELNFGFKFMITNSISDPDFSEVVIPDLFIGYRYEKASGRFIFRTGFNYPTLSNLGIGFKF